MNPVLTSGLTVTGTIGNTPLVRLRRIVPDDCAAIFVKLEYFNPTGSYKDRMALSVIEEAEKRGALKEGMTVVECTAGSTGTSLAFVCRQKGYPFKVVSSDVFAREKLQAMRLFGAELELIHHEAGKITPDLIPKMISHVQQLSEEQGYYWTRQFENRDVLAGYRQMGREILDQLQALPDAFCAAVGTAGMLVGVSGELKKAGSDVRVVVLEPASAPVISQGVKGSHKVDGIAPGFVPPFLDEAVYDEVRTVEEAAARRMARLLASEEGIFAGTSSGLNVAAAIELGRELGPGAVVVTVACDTGLKYLSSGLFDEE